MRKRFRILKRKLLERKKFSDGESINILGKDLKLKFLKTDGQRSLVKIENGFLFVYVPKGKKSDEVLIKWIRDIARKYTSKKLDKLSKDYGFKFNRIAIKDTISRWGSCSSKKNLNFSWRLVLAPIEIFDYVIIHEFCHLKEMNHGIEFWNLVKSMDPEFKSHRMWLRKRGGELF